jgi:Zn finger protein HypA/HybF involved in hydrogenase expression
MVTNTETCVEPEPVKGRCLLCNEPLLFPSKNDICLICGIKMAKFICGKNDDKARI